MRMSQFKVARRRGLTLIEVTVVTAVISILCVLTLAGVASARETARRMTCQNNLQQIGLGILNYESSHACLPLANYPKAFSCLVAILPFIEQGTSYNQLNLSIHAPRAILEGKENYSVASRSMSLFLCPADASVSSVGGRTSYAGSRSSGVQTFGYNGVFSNKVIRLGDITDGTATTVAFSEWITGDGRNLNLRNPARATFETPYPIVGSQDLDRFAASCHSLDSVTAKTSMLAKGSSWLVGEFSYTLYNHVLGPDDRSCLNETLVQEGAWTAGSLHPGGVSTLFADGHVKTVPKSISRNVWRAIASRNGGEVLTDAW